ncbi:MAG TPA: hypothetical protein VI231_11275 [Candidatus Binatia bacterium]|jgi:hypothetical protein
MDLQRINVKFFAAEGCSVPLDAFVGVFNSWIQGSDGEYYDLADYGHVPAGPGVVLVADEANISIDNNGDRLGLLYSRKRTLDGTNRKKLTDSVATALGYCRRLQEEPALEGGVLFRGDEALIIVNDRLRAPNNDETFSVLKPEIEALAKRLYGGATFVLERDLDQRKRFAVRIKAAAHFSIETLMESLRKNVN